MLQEGLEPPTLGLLDPCSTKLSYQSCAAHARDRTKDLQIFSLTLSQLSYMGVHWRKLCVVHPSSFLFFFSLQRQKQKCDDCACRELNPDLMLGKHQ